ncbi:hypothetical protein ABIC28_002263 [Rhodococcus sp. PvR044]|uniref:hypothetical protein n=1 Tax=Rhodococcus TaxID=1827 RepID=UPI000BCAC973|nr:MULTISPECIES: hypothetical protein [Rhodococcus]MCZ4557257.1 hypothetical protein [Rhodococcus maanshanensis]PTR42847.1 hypothetical protein C8K38_110146 [Rhodococcus sp. OK611]SNX91796.1 hypothetical protein SAMN05447004_11181 [Rhodococcus sp. OK270]
MVRWGGAAGAGLVLVTGILVGGCANSDTPGVATAAEAVQVDPAEYSIGDGKHVFHLVSGVAGCWFNPNQADNQAPHMLCDLPLPKSDPPIVDPQTGVRAPADAIVIEPDGVSKVVNVAGAFITGQLLPPGSTLTVGELSCTALDGKSMSCRGPAGSFTFDGSTAEVSIRE